MGALPKSAKSQHKLITADCAYILKTYDEVYDFCGAWCNCDVLESLLKTPTYENAVKHLKSKLERWFVTGYEGGDNRVELPTDDERLQQIRERWGV